MHKYHTVSQSLSHSINRQSNTKYVVAFVFEPYFLQAQISICICIFPYTHTPHLLLLHSFFPCVRLFLLSFVGHTVILMMTVMMWWVSAKRTQNGSQFKWVLVHKSHFQVLGTFQTQTKTTTKSSHYLLSRYVHVILVSPHAHSFAWLDWCCTFFSQSQHHIFTHRNCT